VEQRSDGWFTVGKLRWPGILLASFNFVKSSFSPSESIQNSTHLPIHPPQSSLSPSNTPSLTLYTMDIDFQPIAGPSRSSSPPSQPLTRRGKRRKIIYSDPETEDDDYSQPPSNTDYTPKRIRLTLSFKDEDFYNPISGYTTSELTDSRPSSPVKKKKRKVRPKQVIKREVPSRVKEKVMVISPAIQVRGGGRRPPPRRSTKPIANPRQTRSRHSMNCPVPSGETTLESISHESLLVKNEIARLGLTLRDVTGDGNCLFRALADQLWGNQKRHGELRRLVCDYLEREEGVMGQFVEPFLKDGEGFGGYVERMRQLSGYLLSGCSMWLIGFSLKKHLGVI
jgi:hypothetical protein